MKILFILKHRENPYNSGSSDNYSYSSSLLSSGLYNSANFVCEMLNDSGVEAIMEHAIDNNCIDRLVTKHKPTHVIIEAYWVVPYKFEVLTKLHPTVQWIVRNHSELPFLSSEGIAIDWTCRYVDYPNVNVSGNSPRVLSEMKTIIKESHPEWSHEEAESRVWFLPNFYKATWESRTQLEETDTINIGCFGAIRPLKNQLLQAVSAIQFADNIGKKLNFHINATRIEGGATSATLTNIRSLFDHVKANGHQLIEHGWLNHDAFINLLKNQIDIGLCVSHSETFCIVAADLVTAGVPLVTSKEVVWASGFSQANPNSSKEITHKMSVAWWLRKTGIIETLNLWGLGRYCNKTRKQWLHYFGEN